MSARSRASLLAFVIFCLGASGCVERLLEVRTVPPGASVLVNGKEAGTTPLYHRFSFYGTVSVVLRREGHVSKKLLKKLDPPWFEYFPLDFVAEYFVPWTLEDHHLLEARLEPIPERIDESQWTDLEKRSEEARKQAKPARTQAP